MSDRARSGKRIRFARAQPDTASISGRVLNHGALLPYILSYLPSLALARVMRSSRFWSTTIESRPLLHRVLDFRYARHVPQAAAAVLLKRAAAGVEELNMTDTKSALNAFLRCVNKEGIEFPRLKRLMISLSPGKPMDVPPAIARLCEQRSSTASSSSELSSSSFGVNVVPVLQLHVIPLDQFFAMDAASRLAGELKTALPISINGFLMNSGLCQAPECWGMDPTLIQKCSVGGCGAVRCSAELDYCGSCGFTACVLHGRFAGRCAHCSQRICKSCVFLSCECGAHVCKSCKDFVCPVCREKCIGAFGSCTAFECQGCAKMVCHSCTYKCINLTACYVIDRPKHWRCKACPDLVCDVCDKRVCCASCLESLCTEATCRKKSVKACKRCIHKHASKNH